MPSVTLNVISLVTAPCLPTHFLFFFFSSRRRHTRLQGDWSSDVCSSDLLTRKTSSSKPALPPPTIDKMSSTALRRSEEHTSELQSPCNLVCRLLLEKKYIVVADLAVVHPPVVPLCRHPARLPIYSSRPPQ